MKTPLLNNSSVFNNETPMNKIKNTIDEAMEASFLAALQQSELTDVDRQPEPTTTDSSVDIPRKESISCETDLQDEEDEQLAVNSFTTSADVIGSKTEPDNKNHPIPGNSIDVDINLVQTHPLVMKVYKHKNRNGLKLTMKVKGLLEPINVVRRGEIYFIFDGISRFLAAKELGWETIPVVIFNYTDEEIQEQFVLRNFRTKRPMSELIDQAEIVLEIIGLSQGKRRERIGDVDMADDDFSLVGKDRFEIACEILGVDFSASTLRRIMNLKQVVLNGDEVIKGMRLFDKLDDGSMRINQALNIVNNYQTMKDQEGSNELKETLGALKGQNYKLFNESCEDLSNVEDESVDCAVDSPPYYFQKDYTRKDVIPNQIGLENTVDEYVDRQVEIHLGLFRKLKKSGSLFVVLSDSYQDGVDLMVVEKFTVKMVESGWKFVQKCYWSKENPKPKNNIKRLIPNYEYVLHFVKDVKAYYWREFINWKDGGYKIVKGSNERELSKKRENHSWSLYKPIERFRSFLDSQHVKNVLEANGFTWKELAEIDPSFRHQAPYPSYIPLLPILMTTKRGGTVLDIYNGTSTTTAVAVQLGRKAIGYDIDAVNHVFAGKRMSLVEQNIPATEKIQDLEDEFLIAPAA